MLQWLTQLPSLSPEGACTIFTIRHVDLACQQQVVVKVDIYSYEDIEKAMLEVIHLSGVESVSLMKDTMDVELAVIGDVDPADIVVRLRKCCYAEIVTTGPAKGW